VPGFTSKYKIHRLVYVEQFGRADQAIAREKQLEPKEKNRLDRIAQQACRIFGAPSPDQ
jgi:predicted GIY-YIG superfamily endonuclease